MFESRLGGKQASSAKEDGQHEPEQINNHSGTAREDLIDVGGGGGEEDEMVDVDKALERFEVEFNAKQRTKESYNWCVKKCLKDTGIRSMKRSDLSGQKGRVLILTALNKVPLSTRNMHKSALTAFWDFGLDCAWPLKKSDNRGKNSEVMPRNSPPDSRVKEFAECIRREKDIYYRLMGLLIIQFGWRPSHAFRMKWGNIEYDDKGRPRFFRAKGSKEGFKRNSPVITYIFPDVQEVLMEWAKVLGVDTSPGAVIVPFRIMHDKVKNPRPSGYLDYQEGPGGLGYHRWNEHWMMMCKKFGVKMTPDELRHWVQTTCRKEGLSRPATGYMVGHNTSMGPSMRDWYDQPEQEDIINEQMSVLPNGPLGHLFPPEVQVVNTVTSEDMALMADLKSGKITFADFQNRLLEQKSKEIELRTTIKT